MDLQATCVSSNGALNKFAFAFLMHMFFSMRLKILGKKFSCFCLLVQCHLECVQLKVLVHMQGCTLTPTSLRHAVSPSLYLWLCSVEQIIII